MNTLKEKTHTADRLYSSAGLHSHISEGTAVSSDLVIIDVTVSIMEL